MKKIKLNNIIFVVVMISVIRFAWIDPTVSNAVILGVAIVLWGITMWNEYPVEMRKWWISLWTDKYDKINK